MELQVVSFEVAKLAEKKGFKDECHHAYEDIDGELQSSVDMTGDLRFTTEDMEAARDNDYECYLAPYQEELLKWLRDKYGVRNLYIIPFYVNSILQGYKPVIGLLSGNRIHEFNLQPSFSTYEEALEVALLNELNKLP